MAEDTKERQQYALQTIFSFFLGLMVLAFIGIGVNTFYPQPEHVENPEIMELQREQDKIYQKSDTGDLSDADQARVDEIQKQMERLWEDDALPMELWQRNTSIILIVFATLVMGISLVQSTQLRVLSNGLLLGGLFTMVYGVGWGIASGESVVRFLVVVFALIVTIALGYLKFVRGREATLTAAEAGTAALKPLIARLDALEARASELAQTLNTHEHRG